MLKRAFCYVTRKWVKTFILFTVLLVIATFVLTGISVLQAANSSALRLRQSLGGSIKLELDETKDKNWDRQQVTGGTVVDYIGTPITDADIAKVMEVNGISGYNAIGDGSVYPKNFEFIPGFSFGMEFTDSRLPSTTYSERFPYFAKGSFELVEGRHIVAEDTHVALISTALAEYNNLVMGDTLTVLNSRDYGHPENYSPVTLTIIGIYEFTGEDESFSTTSLLKVNRVVIDHQAMSDISGKSVVEYECGVDFYVDDPAEIDAIAASIQKLELDWDCFKLSIDNSEYLAVASSLEAMQSLVKTLVIIISIISTAILAIILTMWARSRVHETGIYLAIGKSKAVILTQYLMEALLIAVVAFTLSYFTSGLVAQGASNLLFSQASANSKPVNTEDIPDDGTELVDITGKYLPFNTSTVVSAESIEVEVSSTSLIAVYLLGTIILILSVAIASIPTLRMEPKEILTKMS